MRNLLRVMLWDVRVGGPRRLPLLERVEADLYLLLGVSEASSRAWSRRWEGKLYCAAGLHLTTSPQQRPHGAMIASRWPLESAHVIDALPRPERGLVTCIQHPNGPLTAVSWGAPNAAGEGREAKMAAYRHMASLLPTLTAPVLVGVDTNSWYDPTALADPPPAPEWANEHRFLQRGAAHGLQDVYRTRLDADEARRRLLTDLRPHGPLATTFIRRPHRQPRQIAGSIDRGLNFGPHLRFTRPQTACLRGSVPRSPRRRRRPCCRDRRPRAAELVTLQRTP